MVHPNVEYCIKELARESQVDSPSFNNEDRCKIIINHTPIILEAFRDAPDFTLLSVVYEGPLFQTIAETALSANYYWLETGGATLMWEPKSQQMMLGYQGKSESLESETFKHILQNFAKYAEEWKIKLKDLVV